MTFILSKHKNIVLSILDKFVCVDQGSFIGQLSREERDRDRKKENKGFQIKNRYFLFLELFNICQNYPKTGCKPRYSKKLIKGKKLNAKSQSGNTVFDDVT